MCICWPIFFICFLTTPGNCFYTTWFQISQLLWLKLSEAPGEFQCFDGRSVPVSSRWWPTTTARLTTHTHAWCQSLCTASPPCCAGPTSSWHTGSCCWRSPTCRACSVCAPACRTPWQLSEGASWSHSPTFAGVKKICYKSCHDTVFFWAHKQCR